MSAQKTTTADIPILSARMLSDTTTSLLLFSPSSSSLEALLNTPVPSTLPIFMHFLEHSLFFLSFYSLTASFRS
jgi:hypothetical protein